MKKYLVIGNPIDRSQAVIFLELANFAMPQCYLGSPWPHSQDLVGREFSPSRFSLWRWAGDGEIDHSIRPRKQISS